MVAISCPGTVTVHDDGVTGFYAACDQEWEVVPQFTIEDVDLVQAGQAFTAGFVIVASCWAVGMGCRAVLGMIKR